MAKSEVKITTDTQVVNSNKESEIETLLNEISIRVLRLQELQKKQSHKSETTKLCMPVSFGIQKYTPVKE